MFLRNVKMPDNMVLRCGREDCGSRFITNNYFWIETSLLMYGQL